MAHHDLPYEAEDEDDDDDAPIADGGYKQIKDAVLFAIDISTSMLTPSDGKDLATSPALAALKCAFALMQQRIISNPSDMMGILLFGTEKSRFQDDDDENGKRGLHYPHCYLLTDLDVPAASDIRMLKNLVESEGEEQDLLKASGEEVSMANVLFCANQIFTTKAPNFSSRRLFLVTDNDYPHAKSRDLRNSAAVRAKDLYDLGVTIDLFPISHPDRGFTFDRSKFYNDIVYSSEPSDPDAPAPLQSDAQPAAAKDGITLLQSLLSSIASRAAPRRAMFSNLPFEIGPGLKISIKGFIVFKRQEPKRTTYIYLSPKDDTAQIAVGSSTLVADDTARTVDKAEIRKAYKFGGETISFTAAEIVSIKHFGDPVLRIIGFKPATAIPMWANMKQSTFIYPSEEEYIGSTRVFSALYQKMLKDEKIALAWYIARRNATPALVALVAGSEKRSEEGDQTMPPGLWIKPLPFADDIRRAPEVDMVRAPDVLVDAMRPVIEQLQLPKGVYDPKKYPNPALQWFYRILQALALEEDLPEKPEDKTMPKVKQIHKRAGQYITQWSDTLEKAYMDWQAQHRGKPQPSGATKRSQPSTATSSKKVKTEGDDIDVRKAYEGDLLNKLTVSTLKDFASSKGIKSASVKKADLIDAVTRYFETAMDMT